MLKIVQKRKEWIYNFYLTKNVVNTRVGLKIAFKDEPNFFLKGGFSQKRLRSILKPSPMNRDVEAI